MTAEQEAAIDKVMTATLSRNIDWIKFAEAKNAALLTFSSAWILAGAAIGVKSVEVVLPVMRHAMIWATPFFVIAAILSIASFIPRLTLADFYLRKPDITTNYLFFGDLKRLNLRSAYSFISKKYVFETEEKLLSQDYFDDLAAQIVVIANIADMKFQIFKYASVSATGGVIAFSVRAILGV